MGVHRMKNGIRNLLMKDMDADVVLEAADPGVKENPVYLCSGTHGFIVHVQLPFYSQMDSGSHIQANFTFAESIDVKY